MAEDRAIEVDNNGQFGMSLSGGRVWSCSILFDSVRFGALTSDLFGAVGGPGVCRSGPAWTR